MKYERYGRVYRSCRTRYAGVLFWSRLESLWARWFDRHEAVWSYEPRYFRIGDREYTPDFYLPGVQAYLEIKPDAPTGKELWLCRMTAEWSRLPVFMGVGFPWKAEVGCFEVVNDRMTYRGCSPMNLLCKE